MYGLRGPARDRKVGELMQIAGLDGAADLRFNSYSTGMRQMLSFARALLADAAILLVDEPTRSLDPQAADRTRSFLRDELAGKQGKTILWATHDLGEAADCADDIAVISRGRIRLRGPAAKLAAGARVPPPSVRAGRRRFGGPAVTPGTRRQRPGPAILGAFVRRDLREALTYKFSFLSSVVGILLSSATFYFVAKLVPSSTPSLGPFGGDYFSFAVVGVAFAGLLGMFEEGLASVVRSAQLSGTLEALLVTPVPVPVILFGSSLYSLLFQVSRTALHLAVALAFFGLALGRINAAGVLTVGILTVVCFLSVGVLSASFILVYKTGNPFSWILGTVWASRRRRLSGRPSSPLDPLGLLAPSGHLCARRHEEKPPRFVFFRRDPARRRRPGGVQRPPRSAEPRRLPLGRPQGQERRLALPLRTRTVPSSPPIC